MTESDFKQEFPMTPEESFQSSNLNNIFSSRIIAEKYENLLPHLQRNDLKYPLPDLLNSYYNKSLFIYENVKKKKYYMGCDVAGGSGNDRSAISILDEDGNQVCIFYDSRIAPYQFADLIDQLSKYFDGGYGKAFTVVERNSFGESVLYRLKNVFLHENLYKMRTWDQSGRRKMKLGFLNSKSTKNPLIEQFREHVDLGLININSKELLDEMTVFENKGGSMGARRGYHDDLIIAACLSVLGLNVNKWYVLS